MARALLSTARFAATTLVRSSAVSTPSLIQRSSASVLSVRHMGMFSDGLEGARREFDDKKTKEVFHAQALVMVQSEQFGLDEYGKMMLKAAEVGGMGPWKRKLPWIANHKSNKALEQMERLIATCPQSLRHQPSKCRGADKRQWAQAAGVDVKDVSDLLKQYTQMSQMHGWLRRLWFNGEPMPQTLREAQERMMMPGSGISPGRMSKHISKAQGEAMNKFKR